MAKLAPLLDRLARHDEAAAKAGESPARLVISAGKRTRIEGEGDFETISSAALNEDDVRDLLQQTGAGSRLDKLGARPIDWTFRHEGSNFQAEATYSGREFKATIERVRGDAPPKPKPPPPVEEKTSPRERVVKRHDPRSDSAGAMPGVMREVTQPRGYDPRTEEEPQPRRERRRRSQATVDAAPGVSRNATTRREGIPGEVERRSGVLPPHAPDAVPELPRPPAAPPAAAAPPPSVASDDSDVDAWRNVVSSSGSLFSVGDRPTVEAPEPSERTPTLEPLSPPAGPPPSSLGRARPPGSIRPQPVGPPIDLDDVAERIASRRASLPPVLAFDDADLPPGPPPLPPPPKAAPAPAPPPLPSTPGVREAPPQRAAAPVAAAAPAAAVAAPTSAAAPPAARRMPPAATVSVDGKLGRLLDQARSAGASDLHLVAGRPAIARIAGALAPAGDVLEEAALEEMLLPIVPLLQRPALQRNGSVSFAAILGRDGEASRCRIAISRQRTGLKASIRLLMEALPTVEDLELPEPLVAATRHHQGLVLLSGPSGQGKTTTLAALVDHLNSTTTHHILTVEEPIEYVHPRKKAMMSQREVGTHTTSFSVALRSSLREDPDVIVIGELRDVETVRTALSASETGHLVLGTLNTPSAAKTIDRLIDLFPPAEQSQVRATLAGALRLVASQRLLPRADGIGRVAAIEVLPGSLALSNLIRDAKTFQIPSLMQRGRSTGVVRLDDELVELVKRGVIHKKDAIAAADDPAEIALTLEGKTTGERPRGPLPHMAPPPPPPSEAGDERGGGSLWQRAADMFRRGGG